MSEKLKPPQGYTSWLEYAIKAMDTYNPHWESRYCFHAGGWGRVIDGEEMREAARAELCRLKQSEKQCAALRAWWLRWERWLVVNMLDMANEELAAIFREEKKP